MNNKKKGDINIKKKHFLFVLQTANGQDNCGDARLRTSALNRGSLSSDEDMSETSHQASSHTGNNAYLERSVRLDDAASHCKHRFFIFFSFNLFIYAWEKKIFK